MKILFVEDDPMNRVVVRDMLKLVGAEMQEADNAQLGLDMIDDQSFDVVLMDLRMPGMDGMEAIGRIRARGDVKAQLPIIVVTADAAADIRERCMENGADDVLMKPVAMQQLFQIMGKLIVRAGKAQAGVRSAASGAVARVN